MGSEPRSADVSSRVTNMSSEAASVKVAERDGVFWLGLSRGQVQDLMLQESASRGGGRGLFRVILALNGGSERIGVDELARDECYQGGRVSQSVILGLVVLGAFALGEVHGVNALAVDLGMSATTTWRYLKTWEALGVLEERRDRRYQIARRWLDQP